jgi:hypothetical protein
MSCSRFDGRVGYRNQKYEVRAFVAGQERVMGWTNDPTGGSLFTAIEKHPEWHSPRVVEVQQGTVVVAPEE